MALTEDLSVYFADFGVACVHSGSSAQAIHDKDTQRLFDGGALDEEETITLPATSLPGLANGEAVTVAGVSYTVREVHYLDDGKLKRASLKRA